MTRRGRVRRGSLATRAPTHILVAISLVGLGACSRQPAKPIDTTMIAAERAKANIDRYALAKAATTRSARSAAK
ncbi:hypothetical protein FSB78_13060 [Sphingomonas ginsenosidivorax]|uniref:DUF4398 domain-containing protein n=1 Tax=Sphingomonas ginsenosidivorax TaxID=862135 RepID=A0A5C6UI80_9SPHN|nr:hypothetical protein [Sphingomonas ginsenosidivorax]TXC71775.1 hypothetical protein FSB78_13060 [Sphingomonas ginsenosidivorax]